MTLMAVQKSVDTIETVKCFKCVSCDDDSELTPCVIFLSTPTSPHTMEITLQRPQLYQRKPFSHKCPYNYLIKNEYKQ